MTLSAIGRFGVDLYAADNPVHVTPSFRAGESVELEGDGRAMFVLAETAVTGEGYAVTIDQAGAANMISTLNDLTGRVVGFALCALAAGEYGWVITRGVCNARVAASCAANVVLNVTATAGQLDDDATTGSRVVDGVVLDSANGGAAGVVSARVVDARVGAILA